MSTAMAAQKSGSSTFATKSTPPLRPRRLSHRRNGFDTRSNGFDPHYDRRYYGKMCTSITQHLRPLKQAGVLPDAQPNYFGRICTIITQHLRPFKHDSVPPNVDGSEGFFPRKSCSITQHIFNQHKPKRPATAPDCYYGRRSSEVTSHLRYRPPTNLGLDAQNNTIMPNFGKVQTDVVDPARYKEALDVPTVTSHRWKDRPGSAPLPVYPQHVSLEALERALNEKLKGFHYPKKTLSTIDEREEGGRMPNSGAEKISVGVTDSHAVSKDKANVSAQPDGRSYSDASSNNDWSKKHSSCLSNIEAGSTAASTSQRALRNQSIQQISRVGNGGLTGLEVELVRPKHTSSAASSVSAGSSTFPGRTSVEVFPASSRSRNTSRSQAVLLIASDQNQQSYVPASPSGRDCPKPSPSSSSKPTLCPPPPNLAKSSSSSTKNTTAAEIMPASSKSPPVGAGITDSDREEVKGMAHSRRSNSLASSKESSSASSIKIQDKKLKFSSNLASYYKQKLGPESLERIMKWATGLQALTVKSGSKEEKPVDRQFGPVTDHRRKRTDVTAIYHPNW